MYDVKLFRNRNFKWWNVSFAAEYWVHVYCICYVLKKNRSLAKILFKVHTLVTEYIHLPVTIHTQMGSQISLMICLIACRYNTCISDCSILWYLICWWWRSRLLKKHLYCTEYEPPTFLLQNRAIQCGRHFLILMTVWMLSCMPFC